MYIWKFSDDIILDPNVQYINECCEYCELVLEKLKPQISERFDIEPNKIVIGQEDWGWYLEFQKDEIVYILSISFQDKDADGTYNFSVAIEAQKIVKGLIFNRKIDAQKKCQEFIKEIEIVANQSNIQTFEE